ncbi:sugar transferase [Leuconostoc mesenteroides]|uniref:sugar transferase n=1 Tax=Leuconostoc mesenteroides TaxID=1245 RepID=UPI00388A31F5
MVYRKFVKRLLDLLLAIPMLIILLIPLIIVGIIIKLTSEGPVLFIQERYGRNSKPFALYKFRSMTNKAPVKANSEFEDITSYVTPFGMFIRKTSVDELPQLWNIIKGDMSFIGPRPLAKTDEKVLSLRKQNGADQVLPGISGLATGIVALSDKLIPWFFGSSFADMNTVLPILSLLVIVIPGGMSISRQYLIPQDRIKEYNNSVYLGAVISVILNFILIPVLGAIGAAIVSVVVETLIWLIRLKDFWKNTHLGYSRWQFTVNTLTGIIMIFVIKCLTTNMSATPTTTIIQAALGASVYLILTTILKANPALPLLKQMWDDFSKKRNGHS